MPDIQHDLAEDTRHETWLRPAGIAAMVAAALGSILWATPAVSDEPATDSTCRIVVVDHQWTGHGCVDRAADAAG